MTIDMNHEDSCAGGLIDGTLWGAVLSERGKYKLW